MSKTFIISIDGNANADAFLAAVQKTNEVRFRVSDTRSRTVPVLFIYPASDALNVVSKPDHRPNHNSSSRPGSRRTTLPGQGRISREQQARKHNDSG